MRNIGAVILLLLSSAAAALGGPAVTSKPALNQPKEPTKVGSRPYEMKGRKEDRVPLFGFEDLTGWTVQCAGGADGELVRTREQQLWGEYVGKLTYSGTSVDGTLTIRPPKPIPIPDAFDCVSMWIYGNLWEWAPEPGTPQVDVLVLLQDGEGREQTVHLTRIRWKEWWLAHRKLSEPKSGWSFSGIEVRGISNGEPRSIYLDSIYFYKEELKPLRFKPRPRRNLRLPEGQTLGLNTGRGVLPFPTREETILPTNFEKEFSTWTANPVAGRYEFGYMGRDCCVKYVYAPKTGDLGEIRAYVNGRRVCIPMAKGGLELNDGTLARGNLISSSLADGALRVVFDFGGVEAVYTLRIWQKSLVIDFECRGGQAGGVALGELQGLANPRLVRVPFITLGGGRDPRVVCWDGADGPLFASVWVDWYRSNGSVLWSEEWVDETSAKINGGVRYTPKTDGRRNDLFERVFLTVSPVFEETLPTIPNPKTPYGDLAGERLWQESWGPEDYAKQHERSRMLRSYGIDKLTQCNHELTWRDGGESFTLRTRAAPGKGGDAALKDYIAKQKSLGWLAGLYTNYCDFAPVNEYWNEDDVQRTPDGQLRPAWPRCYALKPSRAVEYEEKLAPIIKRKFGTVAAYTDVHTAASPWGYTDFDVRVPGAGTFAATFYAYGELLLNDQNVYGPTWSEGTFQWLYAGLATGNYGLCYGSADLSREPLNVAFDLLKIHPLELDIGMPWTSGFFKEAGWDRPDRLDESIDHFLAATIAYGHIGWLVEETYGIERTCRSYYMLQQLQKRYALQEPLKIEYADASGRFVSVSEAIATGMINDSRLHVVYKNGLELFINGSKQTWSVCSSGGAAVRLPSWGWYARHPESGFEEFSALIDRRRVDYVKSPEYEYLDGRGTPITFAGLAARGAIAVRRSPTLVEVIDIYGNEEIGLTAAFPCKCTAFDAEDKPLGDAEVRRTGDGLVWFKTMKGARRYVLVPVSAHSVSRELVVHLDRDTAVPGDVISGEVTIPLVDGSARPTDLAIAFEGSEAAVHPLIGFNENEGRACFRLKLPKSTDVERRVWVGARVRWSDGAESLGWASAAVVPALQIDLKPCGGGRFRLDVQSNLSEARQPEVRYRFENPGSGLTIAAGGDDTRDITIALQGEPRELEDILVVEAFAGEFAARKEFRVKTVVEHPKIWDLSDAGGFRSGYALRGGPEMESNAASGATFNIEDVPCGGITKRAIFAHPPWIGGVGYSWGVMRTIQLPDTDCELRTSIGIRDGGGWSDGVVFTVLAVDEEGREHPLFSELWAERQWKEVSVNLSRFRGRKIAIKFITDVGPNDNSNADWAAWGDPRIVAKSPIVSIEILD
ncbi:MAG: hypothetical protein QHI38_05915 [Armatimonadota bacterium]|nr:hypothetical protein [Armatimonadota bacterium]